MIGIESVLAVVFLIVAPIVLGLFGGALAWLISRKRAAMERGDV